MALIDTGKYNSELHSNRKVCSPQLAGEILIEIKSKTLLSSKTYSGQIHGFTRCQFHVRLQRFINKPKQKSQPKSNGPTRMMQVLQF